MQKLHNLAQQIYELCCANATLDELRSVILLADEHFTSLRFDRWHDNKIHQELQNHLDREAAQALCAKTIAQQEPVVLLPYLYSEAHDRLYRRVKEDLTLFATDFRGAGNLRFTLSTSSFGSATSHDRPETEKMRVREKLRGLAEQGYEMRQKVNCTNPSLIDCECNRRLLKEYVENVLHARVLSIRTHKDIIRNIECIMPLKNIQHIPCIEGIKEAEIDSNKTTLTIDDIAVIKRSSKDLSFAADFASCQPTSRDLALTNCESLLYELEKVTGTYASVYMQQEASSHSIRLHNQQNHAIISDVKRLAVESIADSATDLFDQVQDGLDRLAMEFGLFASNIAFSPNLLLTLELLPLDDSLARALSNPDKAFKFYEAPSDPFINYIENRLRGSEPHLKSLRITSYDASREGTTCAFRIRTLRAQIETTDDLVLLVNYIKNPEGGTDDVH